MFSLHINKKNPADTASRGTSTSDLTVNELWWNGPSWLNHPEKERPNWKYDKENEDLLFKAEAEHKKARVMYEAKLVVGEGLTRNNRETESMNTPAGISITRFSSLSKLLRVTALVARFIAKLRKQNNSSGPLEAEEILSAEERWIACAQSITTVILLSQSGKTKPINVRTDLVFILTNKVYSDRVED